jgi:hypothetical protein
MATRALGIRHYDIHAVRTLCPIVSIWTIDLAHLLRRCGVNVGFFTTKAGANESYAQETFYADSIAEDVQRVNSLFKTAAAAGIAVHEQSVRVQQLQQIVSTGRHLIIALVDKRQLWGSSEEAPLASTHFLRSTGTKDSTGSAIDAASPSTSASETHYVGHYIVLCGYEAALDVFHIRDPGQQHRHVCVPVSRLEAARKCFGTDEDLLICCVPGKT